MPLRPSHRRELLVRLTMQHRAHDACGTYVLRQTLTADTILEETWNQCGTEDGIPESGIATNMCSVAEWPHTNLSFVDAPRSVKPPILRCDVGAVVHELNRFV